MYNSCAADDVHCFRDKPKPIKGRWYTHDFLAGEGEDYDIINQSYFTEMNQWGISLYWYW